VLVSRKTPHLLGGVSQLPADLRADYFVSASENMLPHSSLGMIRRPPTEHVATVPVTPSGTTLFHEFVRQSTRYLLVATGGDLKVYNALTGAELSVSFPSGKSYLNGTLRAVTQGDRVVLANTSVIIEKSTTVPSAPAKQAVVWFRTGDYGTTYKVTIDGVTSTVTTPVSSTPADKTNTTTTVVANNMLTAMIAALPVSTYTLTIVGSTIFVKRINGADFTISATDGVGDQGISVIKDTVRAAGDLPKSAPDGMIVCVTGDPASNVDDYFVKFTAGVNGSGVWTECAKPAEAISLKASTMPWSLEPAGASTYQNLGAHTPLANISQATATEYSLGFPRNYDVTLTVPNQFYPTGTLVHTVVQGVTYDYTTIGGDTNASIVTALAALIPASTTDYTLSAGGAVLDFAAQPAKSLNIFASITLPANSFYNPSLAMTPAAYVGFALSNTTTGATATIVSNTATLVVTGAWTGGTRNTLLTGDICSVTTAGGANMVCAPLPWEDRAAGDLTTNPFPSFVGRTVDEVYFYQGRLGIAAGDSLVLSRAGNVLSFFRRTATQLLADDVIDVRTANRSAARYHSAAIWRDALYLFTEIGASAMTGQPVLTPTTVRLDPAGQFASAPLRPALAGDSVFIARNANGYTRVAAMVGVPNTENRVTTADSTEGIATYMPGTPTLIIGEGSSGMVFVGTTADSSALYAYSFITQQDGSAAGAWGRWTFPGAQIVGALFSDGKLLLVMNRSGEITIERVNVSSPTSISTYADRQGLGVTVPFSSYVIPHTFHRYTRDEKVDTSGVLTLRKVRVFHEAPSESLVTVAQVGRADALTTDSADTKADIPLYGKNTDLTITLASIGANPMRITSLEWTGTYTNRAQRG
jgi:hypothetical protein